MMSGRQALLCFARRENLKTEAVMRLCCRQLGIRTTGSMCLVSGNDVVPARTVLREWPGIQAGPEISEYQLVIQQS
eukprot:1612003-Amphidinium_carterae.1